MASGSNIEWTDCTWQVTAGCRRVSPGCQNCYAEVMAKRLCGMARADVAAGRDAKGKGPYLHVLDNHGRWNGTCTPVPENLSIPLRWKRPRMVFVNSMSDLFHEDVPFEFIASVFGVMQHCQRHTFQVLTKRPERAAEWYRWIVAHAGAYKSHVNGALTHYAQQASADVRLRENIDKVWASGWPLPNVWIGTSCEDQARADERIPELLRCPAAVRFVSAEPLLGAIDLGFNVATCTCCQRRPSRWVHLPSAVYPDFPMNIVDKKMVAQPGDHRAESNPHGALSVRTPEGLLGIRPSEFECLGKIDWVIIGGESGAGARPCRIEWMRAIARQCERAGVACFVKQLGAHVMVRNDQCSEWLDEIGASVEYVDGAPTFQGDAVRVRLNDAKGGDVDEFPVDLRKREMPGAVKAVAA